MPVQVESYSDAKSAARQLNGGRAVRVLGGGTLLMQRVNAGDPGLQRILRVTDPALRQVSSSGSDVSIGAGVTMAEILADRDLAFLHPAAAKVGGPAIRNMATVGGNLFAKSPYGDLSVLLLALDAKISVSAAGSAGRAEPLERLFQDNGALRNPLVEAVHVTRPAQSAVRFFKMQRVNPRGPAVISVAVSLQMQGRRAARARIAFGGLCKRPCLAPAAARILETRDLTQETIEQAAAQVLQGLSPVSDPVASGWYRGEMARVQLRRMLQQMM